MTKRNAAGKKAKAPKPVKAWAVFRKWDGSLMMNHVYDERVSVIGAARILSSPAAQYGIIRVLVTPIAAKGKRR